MKKIFTLTILLLLFSKLFAQNWNYQAYNTLGIPTSLNYFLLDQEKQTLQFYGVSTKCFSGVLIIKTEQSATDLTITIPPKLSGCDEVRLKIKLDGTGGVREIKQGDVWVPDGLDRKLTLRKE